MGYPIVCICLLMILVASETKETWREWSLCSRGCGGGISSRTGLCEGGTGCSRSTQYKVCNTQKCINGENSQLEEQCAEFNDVPFQGDNYSWVPVGQLSPNCALVCKVDKTAKNITVQLNDSVADGTPCGVSSVCIDRKCLKVGCDDIPGSGTVLDKCGVCDGDGTTCRPRLKYPRRRRRRYQWQVTWMPCSATCGVGYQKMIARCRNTQSKQYVNDRLCHTSIRPKDRSVACKLKACGGKQKDSHWLTGVWSQCPVTCGHGYKYRNVVCQRQGGRACVPGTKPPTKVMCETGVSCDPLKDWSQGKVGLQSLNAYKNSAHAEVPLTPRFIGEDWSTCSVTCGQGVRTRKVQCKVFFQVSGNVEAVPESECYGKKPHEKEVCDLPKCRENETSPGVTGFNQIFSIEETFRWELGNYSECTQSCLRGMQRTRLECVREKNGAIVSPSNCLHLVKPATKTRVCNDIPCPPRWKTGEYGICTADCGGGIQKRTVECVQDIDSGMTKSIAAYRCPDPIPISEQACNTQFCPAQWQTGNWSQCSVTCGPGTQTRRGYCVKTPLRGHTVMVSDVDCLGPKPMTSRECLPSECVSETASPPVIKSENYTFIQLKRSKRVKVTVGGRLVLLPGQSVTVMCPVKNYRRGLLFWSKGFKLISSTGRVRTTYGGNLKIKKANPSLDAGIYTCMADFESAKIIIEFQTKSAAKQKAKEMRRYLGDKKRLENLVLRTEPDPGVVRDPQKNSSKKLVFTTGEWSPCSVTCGSGNQRREVTCARVTYKYVKILPDRECIKWGSAKPPAVQKCSLQGDCPIWKSGKWSKCLSDNCVRDGFAEKKRPVHCVYTNRTVAKLSMCNAEDQPEHKQECVNLDCMSRWQVSKWTECQPYCGNSISKTRMLTCVWKKTNLPAWSTCKRKPRPSAKKPCKPKPCHSDCRDVSRYCSLVGMLRLCRVQGFRERCCQRCRKYNETKS